MDVGSSATVAALGCSFYGLVQRQVKLVTFCNLFELVTEWVAQLDVECC